MRRLAPVIALVLVPAMAWGAAPTLQAGSASYSGAATACTFSLTGVTRATGDVIFAVHVTEAQASSLTTANGFVEVGTQASQESGTAGTATAVRTTVYWKRDATGSDALPVPADSGNYNGCRAFVVKGLRSSGNPWDVVSSTGGGSLFTANTGTYSLTGPTTTIPRTFVLAILGLSGDANDTSSCGTGTNTNLTNIVDQIDESTLTGNGGGLCVSTGTKVSASAVGNTTWANTTNADSYASGLVLALVPADGDSTLIGVGGDGSAGVVSSTSSASTTLTGVGGNGGAGTFSASGGGGGSISRVTGFPVSGKVNNTANTTLDTGNGSTTLPAVSGCVVATAIGSCDNLTLYPLSIGWVGTPSGGGTWTKCAESHHASGTYKDSNVAQVWLAPATSMAAGSQVRLTRTAGDNMDMMVTVDAYTGADCSCTGVKIEQTHADNTAVLPRDTFGSNVTDGSWVLIGALTINGTYTATDVVTGTVEDDQLARTNTNFNGDMHVGHRVQSGTSAPQVGWNKAGDVAVAYKLLVALEVKVGGSGDGTANLVSASGSGSAGTVSATGQSDGTANLTTVSGDGAAGTISANGQSPGTATLTSVSGTGSAGNARAAPVFPLHVSSNNRHLVDANGRPFRIHGDAPWSLIVNTTISEATTYLDDRVSKGFNSVLVNLIDHRFGTNAPANRNSDLPFTTKVGGGAYTGGGDSADFSSWNTTYFTAADSILDLIEARGLLVLLAPAYIGWNAPTTQNVTNEGWSADMQANSSSACYQYGQFLGNRYKNRHNILWVNVADGTPTPGGAMETCSKQVMAGIKAGTGSGASDGLHTAHLSRTQNSTDDLTISSTGSWDVNSVYVKPTSATGTPFTQGRGAYAYSPALPAYVIEDYYENSAPDRTSLRYEAWGDTLSVTGGFIFGNSPLWAFGNTAGPGATSWTPYANLAAALATNGAADMQTMGRFFDSIPWWRLEPSSIPPATALCTAGCGTEGASTYVPAAVAPSGSIGLAYVPHAHAGSVTIDLSKFSGQIHASWLDPASGSETVIADYAPSGTQAFTTPGTNSVGASDWVLVLRTSAADVGSASSNGSVGNLTSNSTSVATLTGISGNGGAGTLNTSNTATSTLAGLGGSGSVGAASVSGASGSTLAGTGGSGSVGTFSVNSASTGTLTGIGGSGVVGGVSSNSASSSSFVSLGGSGFVGTMSANGGAAGTANISSLGGSGFIGTTSGQSSSDLTITRVGGDGGIGLVSATSTASSTVSSIGGSGTPGTYSSNSTGSTTLSVLSGDGFTGALSASGGSTGSATLTSLFGNGETGAFSVASGASRTLSSSGGDGAVGAVSTSNVISRTLSSLAGDGGTGNLSVVFSSTSTLTTLTGDGLVGTISTANGAATTLTTVSGSGSAGVMNAVNESTALLTAAAAVGTAGILSATSSAVATLSSVGGVGAIGPMVDLAHAIRVYIRTMRPATTTWTRRPNITLTSPR